MKLNNDFLARIEQHKAEKEVRKIHNLYDSRFNEFAEAEKNKVNTKQQYKSANFIAFLKENHESEIAQKYLLKLCYDEIFPQGPDYYSLPD